jgi:hypothetical protein
MCLELALAQRLGLCIRSRNAVQKNSKHIVPFVEQLFCRSDSGDRASLSVAERLRPRVFLERPPTSGRLFLEPPPTPPMVQRRPQGTPPGVAPRSRHPAGHRELPDFYRSHEPRMPPRMPPWVYAATARVDAGCDSVALSLCHCVSLSLCATTHPFHTMFMSITYSVPLLLTRHAMRPHPRAEARSRGRGGSTFLTLRPGQRPHAVLPMQSAR